MAGAQLSWEPPQNTNGTILEYSVYLAVRNTSSATTGNANNKTTQLAFVRVYCGTTPACTVGELPVPPLAYLLRGFVTTVGYGLWRII